MARCWSATTARRGGRPGPPALTGICSSPEYPAAARASGVKTAIHLALTQWIWAFTPFGGAGAAHREARRTPFATPAPPVTLRGANPHQLGSDLTRRRAQRNTAGSADPAAPGGRAGPASAPAVLIGAARVAGTSVEARATTSGTPMATRIITSVSGGAPWSTDQVGLGIGDERARASRPAARRTPRRRPGTGSRPGRPPRPGPACRRWPGRGSVVCKVSQE